MSLYHCTIFFICNIPEVKFMSISTHTEYRKNCVIPHAKKRDCASAQMNDYWSQTREGRLCGAQTTAKVNCKLHSHIL
jgi:hypothetical protein